MAPITGAKSSCGKEVPEQDAFGGGRCMLKWFPKWPPTAPMNLNCMHEKENRSQFFKR